MSEMDSDRIAVDALPAAHDVLAAQMLALNGELVSVHEHLKSEIDERQRVEQLLQESQQLLRHLLAHQERIREQERKRIAREIHDELAQNLLSLRFDVARLQVRTSGSHPVLHDRSSAALKQIDLSMQSVRNIINNLHPAVLDLGLYAAIEWQIQSFRQRSGIACKLTSESSLKSSLKSSSGSRTELSPDATELCQRLSEDSALMVFRILQESLNNIVRHAQATTVAVQLLAQPSGLCLRIADDGIGMDLDAQRNGNSFGLISMRERVSNLHGTLEIISAPGQGMELIVTIPLE